MDAMHEPATSSESGEKGDATRKRLEYFVANVMDQKLRFVPEDDMEADSPDALVKSKATRIVIQQPGEVGLLRILRPRDVSPE